MGSSAALHLLRFGYSPSNIIVLDTYPIPSAQSAGNDLNKIMGVRPRDDIAVKLELEALDMWLNDRLFRPYFHNTGRVRSPVDSPAADVMLTELSLIARHQGPG